MDQQSSPSATPSQNRPQPGGRRLPLSRKLLFAAAATVIFFAVLEAVLALVGVAPRAYEEDPYVGFSGRAPLFVEVRQADGSVVMERSPAKASLFNMQRFPKVKARAPPASSAWAAPPPTAIPTRTRPRSAAGCASS